jgi:hypothetical protein
MLYLTPTFATFGASAFAGSSKRTRRWASFLADFVVRERGANLVDVTAVYPDGFVKLSAGDTELFRPVSDVGGHLGIDLFGVVGGCGGFGVLGVGSAEFGLLDFFVLVRARLIGVRHGFVPLSAFLRVRCRNAEGLRIVPHRLVRGQGATPMVLVWCGQGIVGFQGLEEPSG